MCGWGEAGERGSLLGEPAVARVAGGDEACRSWGERSPASASFVGANEDIGRVSGGKAGRDSSGHGERGTSGKPGGERGKERGGLTMRERIREGGDWRGEGVAPVADLKTRRVRDVALTGQESRNGYRYGAGVLERAVVLYENRPVFLDHADALTRPFDRSARDLIGHVVEPRFEDGRIRGDIEVLATEAGDTFLALAASESEAVGMSHVVTVQRDADGTVGEIVEVVSVDAVAFPATNATFAEQRGAGVVDQEDWRERCLAVIAERRELAERLTEVERRARRGDRERETRLQCAAGGVSLEDLGSKFAGLVAEVEDDRLREELVRERIESLRERVRPWSLERGGVGSSGDERWVRAIRG